MITTRPIAVTMLLAWTFTAHSANVHVAPSANGNGDGTTIANAAPASALSAKIAAAQPGDTIFLEGGTYNRAIELAGNGLAGKPIVLVGRDTANPPVLSGMSGDAITVSGVRYWTVGNIEVDGVATAVQMDGADNILVTRVRSTNGYDPFWLNAATNVRLVDCSAVKYEKKGYRISKSGGSNVEFVRCLADATGGDPSLIASRNAYCMGFWIDVNTTGGKTHHITYTDCIARNNLNASSLSYKNGDGFCVENPSSDVTFRNCTACDNQDGGFDVKCEKATYEGCIAFRNYRGFRAWEGEHSYSNCISGYNTNAGLWSGRSSAVTATKSTFVGSDKAFNEDGGTIQAVDCILFDNPQSEGTVKGCVTDDPQFAAPSPEWKGEPREAFNSLKYGTTKGYYYSNGTVRVRRHAVPVARWGTLSGPRFAGEYMVNGRSPRAGASSLAVRVAAKSHVSRPQVRGGNEGLFD